MADSFTTLVTITPKPSTTTPTAPPPDKTVGGQDGLYKNAGQSQPQTAGK